MSKIRAFHFVFLTFLVSACTPLPELPPTIEGAAEVPVSHEYNKFTFSYIRKGCGIMGAKISSKIDITYPYFQMVALDKENQTRAKFFVQCDPVIADGSAYCKVSASGSGTEIYGAGPYCADWSRLELVN